MMSNFWMSYWWVVGVIMIVLPLPIYAVWRDRQRQETWRQMAQARGWHYAHAGWWRFWSPRFVLSGTAVNDITWQLRPIRRYRQTFYQWRTDDLKLPYGVIIILPAHPAAPRRILAGVSVRPYTVPSQLWSAQFQMMVSHQKLGDRYFSMHTERIMRKWPVWPAAGALEEAVWDQGGLLITGRYAKGWHIFDQLVNTGCSMLQQAAQPQTSNQAFLGEW